MFKKIVSFAVALTLLMSVSAFASPTLTPEQLKDVQMAKQKTQQVMKRLQSYDNPKFYGDPKVISSKALLQDDPVSSRPGVYYVTFDSSSSSLISWAGGHAGIVYNEDYVIESWGNKGDDLNGVHLWPNNWASRYTHMEARTVRSTTVSEDEQAAELAYSYIGKPYNYNFFDIDQDDSFYCSQLVWYVFYHTADVDLNDGGAVWPVDLSETDESYVIYSK
ncbi:YiiX/YebB-like N1pC/P60 family cysteine hydrolase [Thermicanus aegyptius]|uniref:YiiX/YebB-like N1pC/P60 family cysteine hydrolase n=1 Tax=Thermicanus aegyptius TaxID=94009 RepID=UPI000694CB47|nr:YiiX/YebB-like N1pC/P60 family cysteine hydrolase [Thermicanus aegyptius]